MDLNLKNWNRVWLSKPFNIEQVPGSAMIMLNGVKGYLTPGDLVFLFNLAAELPQGGNYLEVGSWMGLSSIIFSNGLLANLNLDAKVYCVDTWEGSAEHQTDETVRSGMLYQTFLSNVSKASMDRFIRPVKGKSEQVAEKWPGPFMDIIFIDGDHTFEGCYNDVKAWLPWLNKKGRMVGHDAVPEKGVARALEKLSGELGVSFRVHEPPNGHYLWEMIKTL